MMRRVALGLAVLSSARRNDSRNPASQISATLKMILLAVPAGAPPAAGCVFRYCSLVQNERLETPSATSRNSLPTRVLLIVAIALVGGLLGWSYVSGGIFRVLLHSGPAEEKVAALRALFDGFGIAAPLAYVG